MKSSSTSPQPIVFAAWSARCDCRNNHASSSGRCNNRDVTDPTRRSEDMFAACESCRQHCPCGTGSWHGLKLPPALPTQPVAPTPPKETFPFSQLTASPRPAYMVLSRREISEMLKVMDENRSVCEFAMSDCVVLEATVHLDDIQGIQVGFRSARRP